MEQAMDNLQPTNQPPQSSAVEAALAQIAAFDPVLAIAADYLPRFMAREGVVMAAAAGQERRGAIAVIPVHGALLPRGGRGLFGMGAGMDALRSQLRQFANDGDIAAIVLDIDSPGGTVAGTVETAAEVKAAAQKKPVIAVANTLAASAAYWIGSQASEFVSAPSADVGSIGAMAMHVDLSSALSSMGIKVTMIRSAPYKNEASPFAPLSAEALTHYQGRVDEAGNDFIRAVADGRKVTQTKVREGFGQGRVYGAREAMSRGMVDRVATLDDVVMGLADQYAPRRNVRRRSALSFA